MTSFVGVKAVARESGRTGLEADEIRDQIDVIQVREGLDDSLESLVNRVMAILRKVSIQPGTMKISDSKPDSRCSFESSSSPASTVDRPFRKRSA